MLPETPTRAPAAHACHENEIVLDPPHSRHEPDGAPSEAEPRSERLRRGTGVHEPSSTWYLVDPSADA
jgi:hypothetical protein